MEMNALFEAVERAEEEQQRLSEAARRQRMHVHHVQQPRGARGLAVRLEATPVSGYEAPSPSAMRIHDILNSEQDDDDDDQTLQSTQQHASGGVHAYNQHVQQVAQMRFHLDHADGDADMLRNGGDSEDNNAGTVGNAPTWWFGATTTSNANATIRDEAETQTSKLQQPRADRIGPSDNGSLGTRMLLLNERAAPPSSSMGVRSIPVNPSRGGMRKYNTPMENGSRARTPPVVAQPRPNPRMWTPQEKEAFWNGYRIHGPDWKAIKAEFVTTRTAKQIAAFAHRSDAPASVNAKALASNALSASNRQLGGAAALLSDLIARVPAPPKAAPTTAPPVQEVAPQQDSGRVLDLSENVAADTKSQQRPQRATRPRKKPVQQLAGDENESLTAAISLMINVSEQQQQRNAHETMPVENVAKVAAEEEKDDAVMTEQDAEQQQTKPRRTSRQGKKTLKAREAAAMSNHRNAVGATTVPPRLAFEGITITDDLQHSTSSMSSWTENHNMIEVFTEEETPEKRTKRDSSLQQVQIPILSKRSAQRSSWAMQSPILQKKPKITEKSAVAWPTRGKKRRQRPELDASAIAPGDGRPCDFCHKTQGVCALMHCAACRRAYHAKCFVGHFRPHCKMHATAENEDVVPIEKQIEALQLNPPDNVRVTIFRCGPCHAAFIEFFNSGGYEWDCECPSCKEPEKLIAYRRQMLLKIMLNEDGPKEKKSKGAAAGKQVESSENTSAENAPQESKKTAARGGGGGAALPRRTGSRRRAALSSVTTSDESEAMTADSAEGIAVAAAQLAEAQERRSKALRRDEHAVKGNGDGGTQSAADVDEGDGAAPEQENDTIDKAGDSRETPGEPKSELSGDEKLLAAVTIKFDSGRDCFDVVCVVDTSTGESIKKTGLYFVEQPEQPRRCAEREDIDEEGECEPKGESVYCYCCDKDLTLAQFVRHSTTPAPSAATAFFVADPPLPEAVAALADPHACLFVRHRDGDGLTPLAKFLDVLQKRQRAATTATGGSPAESKTQQRKPSSAEKRIKDAVPSASGTLAEARQILTEAVISRRYAATKSPRNVVPMYAIKLVCLSKKLMIQMPGGVMQSKMDPSVQGDYPYKEGWLSFDAGVAPRNTDSKPPTMSAVQCLCCKQDMALDAFIAHTKLEDWGQKFKRRFVFVPQVGNERKLVELEKIWQAVTTLYQHQRLDQFLQHKVQAIER